LNRNPATRKEWQDAVDAAAGAITLEAARQYGLVTGGPEVNMARCDEIIERAAKLGIQPSPDSIKRFVRAVQEKKA
jgi:hypothetical protein